MAILLMGCEKNSQENLPKKILLEKLGEELFFDKRLSSNGKVACITCHEPQKAFTDGLALSNKGVSGKKLLRNSPTLIHAKYTTSFFWDGGATNLESQAVAPLQHPDEMNQDLRLLVKKLQKDEQYSKQFKQVFATDSLTTSHILKALAAYQRSLSPQKTIFDSWFYENDTLLGFPNPHKKQLADLALQGYAIFMTHCTTCHPPPLFTDNSFHHNGLDSLFEDESNEKIYLGRFRITNQAQDIGKFKTPTLRNLILTPPYMHDGRFATLDEVLQHYATLRYASPKKQKYMDNKLKNLVLTPQEVQALNEFLKTL